MNQKLEFGKEFNLNFAAWAKTRRYGLATQAVWPTNHLGRPQQRWSRVGYTLRSNAEARSGHGEHTRGVVWLAMIRRRADFDAVFTKSIAVAQRTR
jgi:hypothetical protein